MIRLTSFLWVWFQCVCPLMPSCNTYRLTWVSLTLGVGYLFKAAPAKRSLCSLPWTRVSPHRCPSWTSMWDSSSRPSCARAATALGNSSRRAPGLGRGLLLQAAAPEEPITEKRMVWVGKQVKSKEGVVSCKAREEVNQRGGSDWF